MLITYILPMQQDLQVIFYHERYLFKSGLIIMIPYQLPVLYYIFKQFKPLQQVEKYKELLYTEYTAELLPGEYGFRYVRGLLYGYTGRAYSAEIKEVSDMYFVGLVVFTAFLVCSIMFSGAPASFVDLPSIIIIMAISIPMLMASGLLTDFIRGFKVMGQKVNTWSLLELKKTEVALKLMTKLLLLSGSFGSLIGVVSIFSSLSDIRKIWPNLAVALLTLLYSVLLVFILLPVQARVKAIILTMDKEC